MRPTVFSDSRIDDEHGSVGPIADIQQSIAGFHNVIGPLAAANRKIVAGSARAVFRRRHTECAYTDVIAPPAPLSVVASPQANDLLPPLERIGQRKQSARLGVEIDSGAKAGDAVSAAALSAGDSSVGDLSSVLAG